MSPSSPPPKPRNGGNVEITATFINERFVFDNPDSVDVAISTAELVKGETPSGASTKTWKSNRITLKGPVENDLGHTLQPNVAYLFHGRWSEYENRRTKETETQFHYHSFAIAKPTTGSGIINYLALHGEGCGVGKGRASALYDLFGNETLDVCRTDPKRACCAIHGWSLRSAEELAKKLEAEKRLESASIALIELFNGRGFPKSTKGMALKLWGAAAPDVITADPYVLMQFKGCGFLRCDKLYLDLDHDPLAIRRQAMCVWHEIAKDSTGGTWFQASTVIQSLARIPQASPIEAVKYALTHGLLAKQRTAIYDNGVELPDDNGPHLYLAETIDANRERNIAKLVAQALSGIETEVVFTPSASTSPDGGVAYRAIRRSRHWPPAGSIPTISEHQAIELGSACAGQIGIMDGSPGTGKTYTVAALIKALLDSGCGSEHIAICAPTGKAAVRVTQAMQANGVAIYAKTIHSLLGIRSSGGGFKFEHDARNPLPHTFIVVDEASMLDNFLAESILSARGMGACVLFVGDTNQLPPVGRGTPLRDMIGAGVPTGTLTEIRRNSGQIVEVCAAIRSGLDWSASDELDYEMDEANNVVLKSCRTPESQLKAVMDCINEHAASVSDRVWDIQVLAAVNEKSPLARKEVNTILRTQLNPNPESPGSPFRIHDKIINTKNSGFQLEADRSTSIYVANGEMARVEEIHPKHWIATLVNSTDQHRIIIPRGRPEADESSENPSGLSWDLAYAISTHKSQGSSWPIVIVLLDEYPGALRIASREWIYTAISRAEKLTILVGKEATAKRMVGRTALADRRTFLKDFIVSAIHADQALNEELSI